MVENGQATPVAQFGFSNPERPRLGLEVLDFGTLYRRLPPETAAAVHRTDFHQLFLFTGGTGTTMVDFIDQPCAAGTLLYVCPGRVLRLPQAGLDALMVLFTPSFTPRLERFPALLGPFAPTTLSVPADESSLRRAMLELKSEYRRAVKDSSPVTVELLRQLLGALLLRIHRLPAEDSVVTGNETFQRFQHELERSFATTRNAAHYAARIGYSLRSLNRLCQASTGQTAKALIDARVALEAKRLLAHTALPVAAIGHRLGFTEPTNFGKFFSRESGMTPGDFRDRERG